jgi:ACS family allantoate permease-like MFS transporter
MESEKVLMDAASGPKDVGSGEVFNHSDADIAAAYADRLDGENAYTLQEEKRLRWKLDLRLVPILWLNVTLSAMDKVTTSTAALYGMKAATGLTGNRYSWVGSAFYVSVFMDTLSFIC